ncbi:MAG: hypothetical protein FIB08_13380 [Candidatus Methanoperedens sp.]|nr:hypothetical protein [Candidatus Methanoperedens sp.]
MPGHKKCRIEGIACNKTSGGFFQEINTVSINRNIGLINLHGTVRLIRILGLMALISYMVVILFTWMYANLEGYVYFSAGEPELYIKYSEWALGFIGILVAADFLKKELES